MRRSDQQLQIERLWASAIRQTRRAVQIPERELEQKENAFRAELAKLPEAACPRAILQSIEQTLYQSEAGVRERLLKLESAYRQANIELKLRGLDALTQENNAFWQEVATSLDTLAHALKSQGEQFRGDAHKADSKRDLPLLPESNFDRIDMISRVAGRDTDIDLLLRSLGNVLRDYEQRKRRRRIAFLGARVLIFLGFVFLADYALGFVEPLPFYLLVAAFAWFLDEYLIRPALDRRFEVWNARALEQTIGDFYRAQRRVLYLTALLETRMQAAAAVLETAQT